jgi:hypothetical protein
VLDHLEIEVVGEIDEKCESSGEVWLELLAQVADKVGE